MDFTKNFLNEIAIITQKIDAQKIDQMVEIVRQLREVKGRLFILGVGGSAGNSSHAVNDFRKLAGVEAYAPTDNISEVTARTNDEGFETIFTEYLSVSNLCEKDCIFILSVGGGNIEAGISTNLCNAIDFAKSVKAKTIGIVGREDGYTHKFADVCLVIPQVNASAITPYSEAFQGIIWHLMVSHPRLKANDTKW